MTNKKNTVKTFRKLAETIFTQIETLHRENRYTEMREIARELDRYNIKLEVIIHDETLIYAELKRYYGVQ